MKRTISMRSAASNTPSISPATQGGLGDLAGLTTSCAVVCPGRALVVCKSRTAVATRGDQLGRILSAHRARGG